MAIRIYNQPARMQSSRSDDLTTGFRMVGFYGMSLWRAARVCSAKADEDSLSRSLTPLFLSPSPPLSLPLSLCCLSLCLPLPLSFPRSLSLSPSLLLSLPFFHALLPHYVSHSLTHPSTLSLSLSLIISFSVVP